jgi:hypothetical protein
MNKTKRLVPAFATEAEEAAWWYENRENHGQELLEAVPSGEAQRLTPEGLKSRIEKSNTRGKQKAG